MHNRLILPNYEQKGVGPLYEKCITHMRGTHVTIPSARDLKRGRKLVQSLIPPFSEPANFQVPGYEEAAWNGAGHRFYEKQWLQKLFPGVESHRVVALETIAFVIIILFFRIHLIRWNTGWFFDIWLPL